MSSTRCFVSGCPNDIVQRKKVGRVVHYFRPGCQASDELCQKWVSVIPPRRGKDINTLTPFHCANVKHVICELHFDEACLIRQDNYVVKGEKVAVPRERWKLTENAVPTKFGKDLGCSKRRGRSKMKKDAKNVEMTPPSDEPEESTASVRNKQSLYDLYKKKYYCSLCLETFVEGVEFLKSVKSKDSSYLKFVSFMEKYVELDFESVKRVFSREGHQQRINSPFYRTLCDRCLDSVERICKLFTEFELLQMKLNSEILAVSQVLEKEDWEERKSGLEREMGRDKMNHVVIVNQGIKRKRNMFLMPQVVLKPLTKKNSQMPLDKPAVIEEDEISIKYPGKSAAVSRGHINLPENGLICGRAGFFNLLGLGKIINCMACDKYFPSKEELHQHQLAYHYRKHKQPQPPSNPVQVPESQSALNNLIKKEKPTVPPPPTSAKKLPPIPTNSSRNSSGDGPSTAISSWVNSTKSVMKTPTLVLNDTLLDKPKKVVNQENNIENEVGENENEDINDDMMSLCPSPAALSIGNDDDDAEMELGAEAADFGHATTTFDPAQPEPLLEPKQEVEEAPTSSTTTKVPFMSSEYIGKYKIVCKLMNIKTGKTCVGVVAKTPVGASSLLPNSNNIATTGDALPRVISVEPEIAVVKQEKSKVNPIPIPPISGPPYKCPVEGCTKQYTFKRKCILHYRLHRRQMHNLQKKIEGGEAVGTKKKGKQKKEQEVENMEEQEGQDEQASNQMTNSKKNKKYLHPCKVAGCRAKFQKKQRLDYHQSVKHNPVQCHFCSQDIPSIVQLISHEMVEHEQTRPATDAKPYCPRCNETTFPGKNSLRDHYATVHFQLSPPPIPEKNLPFCTECNRQFFSLQLYTRHIIKYHEDDPTTLDRELPHKCSSCDRRFRFEIHLRLHHKKVHEKGSKSPRPPLPVFRCHICGKVYIRNRYRYESHMKLHTKNTSWDGKTKILSNDVSEPTYNCEYCGRLFRREGSLWLHKRKVHEGPTPRDTSKPFECSECGRSFSTKSWLNFHVSTTHRSKPPKIPKQVKATCDVCGKIWPHRGLLRYHVRRVHPEVAHKYAVDPEQGFVCDQCGKVYELKSCLKKHMDRWCQGQEK